MKEINIRYLSGKDIAELDMSNEEILDAHDMRVAYLPRTTKKP